MYAIDNNFAYRKCDIVKEGGNNAKALFEHLKDKKDLYTAKQEVACMTFMKAFMMTGCKNHYLQSPFDHCQITKPFNRGQGRLALCYFDFETETVIINKVIWNDYDKRHLQYVALPKSWKIKYVELGYPDYYEIKTLKKAKEWKS